MWFQKLASLALVILAVYLTYRFSGLNKIIKFEGGAEPEAKKSALENNIKELEDKKKLFSELEQNITVVKEMKEIDRQIEVLIKKLNKLQ
jgi:preprotein translocase subunit SecF